jgi:hypothetical protein
MPVSLSEVQLFSNNAVSLLTAPISATSTSLTVMAGYGALFPNPGPGEYFLVTLEDQAATTREIIKVTQRVGDTLYFSLSDRGMEGTTAQAWSSAVGNETLVDHRVTAETMQRAMQLPVSTGAGDVPGGTSTSTVLGAQTAIVDEADYSSTKRGFKFFVTLYAPSNFNSTTFEVLCNVRGDLLNDLESGTWNVSSRVGDRFLGTASIVLDTALKKIRLVWQNDEAFDVEVTVTRIQH